MQDTFAIGRAQAILDQACREDIPVPFLERRGCLLAKVNTLPARCPSGRLPFADGEDKVDQLVYQLFELSVDDAKIGRADDEDDK